ncbi:LXG domain-containing protein [Bhargavaea ginsengi]|uniref:T7SS effector LXG polymorphic toxin n=1 Tax=Bhargavaea ginsengi TaxID=426757 RepID=UPI00203E5773|nr:T7SS effector LXG polymorphic toxin [Bhargavaea ginsengi]MCM3089177.1 LXG domain-containing protein [Bhargavaea ginsengi]
MKVLDVTLFREGMQRNVETLMRLEEEMQMIRAATEELLALQESLKGEGGDAIRAFYRDCHLPLLQYFGMFKSQFQTILQQMDSALNALEPATGGHIRESFLESEVESGLSEIATAFPESNPEVGVPGDFGVHPLTLANQTEGDVLPGCQPS